MFGDGSPNFNTCKRLHESQEVQILIFLLFFYDPASAILLDYHNR